MKKIDDYTSEQRKQVWASSVKFGVKLWLSVYIMALLFVIIGGAAGMSPLIGGIIFGVFAAIFGVTYTWRMRARIKADIASKRQPSSPRPGSSASSNDSQS